MGEEVEVEPDAAGLNVSRLSHSVNNIHSLVELHPWMPEQPLINVISTWRLSCKIPCLHTFITQYNSALFAELHLNWIHDQYFPPSLRLPVVPTWRHFCLRHARLTYVFVSDNPHFMVLGSSLVTACHWHTYDFSIYISQSNKAWTSFTFCWRFGLLNVCPHVSLPSLCFFSLLSALL